MGRQGIELDVDLDSVQYDALRAMMHVWSNLLDNAIKFALASTIKKMRLSCCRRAGGILFEDRDGNQAAAQARHF